MSLHVAFRNPRTGEIKQVKVGWSWVLFLFSGVFGLPLFLRRLYVWGGIFLVLWLVNLIAPSLMYEEDANVTIAIFGVVFLSLQIWLGIKGNEMTAKNYLDNGWVFAEPDSDITRNAKLRWGVA
jgi:hypothetical protein